MADHLHGNSARPAREIQIPYGSQAKVVEQAARTTSCQADRPPGIAKVANPPPATMKHRSDDLTAFSRKVKNPRVMRYIGSGTIWDDELIL